MRAKRRIKKQFFILGLSLFVVLVMTVSIVVPYFRSGDEDAGAGEIAEVILSGTSGNGTILERQSQQTNHLRKTIFDRNYRELAVSFPQASIYVRPFELKRKKVAASQLADLLDKDAEELADEFSSKSEIVWVAKGISPAVAQSIRELQLSGVYCINESKRFYPNGRTAAHVIGFVSDNHGLDGIEYSFDSLLNGDDIFDQQGSDLVLTLDFETQIELESIIADALEKSRAESAKAVVINPDTGAVLAMVSMPSFNPNRFWEYAEKDRLNRVLREPVYPSGFSGLFHYAAALEKSVVVLNGALPSNELRRKANLKTKPVKQWQQVSGGVYVSPQLAKVGSALNPMDDGLRKFFNNNQITDNVYGDLPKMQQQELQEDRRAFPDKKTAPESALNVLAAFSSLINGGYFVKPYLVEKGKVENQPKRVFQKRVSTALINRMAGFSDDNVVCFEAMISDKSYKYDKAEESDREIISQHEIKGQIKGAHEHSGEKPETEIDSSVIETHALMLGYSKSGQNNVAFLISLDKAEQDLDQGSFLRTIVEEKKFKSMLRYATKPVKEFKSTQVVSPSEDTIRKWQSFLGNKVEIIVPQKIKKGAMPDVSGLSLRSALQVLQPFEVEVRVVGAGRVVSQYPSAGTALSGGNCILKLHDEL